MHIAEIYGARFLLNVPRTRHPSRCNRPYPRYHIKDLLNYLAKFYSRNEIRPGSHPSLPASRQAPLRSSQISIKRPRYSESSARERDERQYFQNAPHRSAIFIKIVRTLSTFSKFSGRSARERDFWKIIRTLSTGARFFSKLSRRSARERDFSQNYQDAQHGSAIFLNIFQMLSTGARFFSKFSRRSARERDFSQNYQDAPHGSAIVLKIIRTLSTGARVFSKFSGRSARERDFWKIIRTLSTGARFFSKFSGRSARERDCSQTFQAAPHGSVILIKRERS